VDSSTERGHTRPIALFFFSGHHLTNIQQRSVMFAHSGYRPLWPLIFFLPWLFLGSAYLGGWVLHRRSRSVGLSSVRPRHRTALVAGILFIIAFCFLLIVAPSALADPVREDYAACPVTTEAQVRNMADSLFELGDYQSAGVCYQAAGENALANRAFMKALEPRSELTARQLSEQRDQANRLLRKVQLAFRSGH